MLMKWVKINSFIDSLILHMKWVKINSFIDSLTHNKHYTYLQNAGCLFVCFFPNTSFILYEYILIFQSYKRRFFYLKQLADKSFLLEYHKDERSASAKGHVYLDSLQDVNKVRLK